MNCPRCRSPHYDPGLVCIHCNYIDGQLVRAARANVPPPQDAPPPPPPRDAPPPLPPRTGQLPPPPVPPRGPVPPPRTGQLPPPPVLPAQSQAQSRLPPPPPRPTRTAPVDARPTHLSASGSDWVEASFPGTDVRVSILLQPQMMNCGPSSLCILLRQATGAIVPVGMMGARVRSDAREVIPISATTDAQASVASALNFGSRGSDLINLLNVLQSKYGAVKARPNDGTSPLSTQLATHCSPQKPALCHIAWSEGGHFTVCLGVAGDKLLFADPFYGAVVCTRPVQPTSSIPYSTAINTTGQPAGAGTIRAAILTDPPART